MNRRCQMPLWRISKKDVVGQVFMGVLFVGAMVALLWGPYYIAPLFIK